MNTEQLLIITNMIYLIILFIMVFYIRLQKKKFLHEKVMGVFNKDEELKERDVIEEGL